MPKITYDTWTGQKLPSLKATYARHGILTPVSMLCSSNTAFSVIKAIMEIGADFVLVLVLNLPDNIPDEASPGNWLGLQRQADWHNLVNDSSLCNVSKYRLKQFNVGAVTVFPSSLFQTLIIRSLKKCWRRSRRERWFCNFNEWPLIRCSSEYSKKVKKLMFDKPRMILYTSIRSALIGRCSKDHKPSFLL